MNTENKEVKWIKHYSSSHKILLVGEGDFSFSLCLARTFGFAANMVSTSLNSREELSWKYRHAIMNLEELRERGCCIVHEVDAKSMRQHSLLRRKLFDRIVFNFPHSAFPCKEHSIRTIERHQGVVRGFLRNAIEMLTENGEIHITHKTARPYCRWEIENLAEEVDLFLIEKAEFRICDYPYYENKKGDGLYCGNFTFPAGESSTFKFAKLSLYR